MVPSFKLKGDSIKPPLTPRGVWFKILFKPKEGEGGQKTPFKTEREVWFEPFFFQTFFSSSPHLEIFAPHNPFGTPPPRDRLDRLPQNFRAFLSLSCHNFILSSFFWGLLVEFWCFFF